MSFVVFKKELDNNFESLLLKCKKKSIDHIASKYVNYMGNNPFNKMIKKIVSEISIRCGFYGLKPVDYSPDLKVLVIPVIHQFSII